MFINTDISICDILTDVYLYTYMPPLILPTFIDQNQSLQSAAFQSGADVSRAGTRQSAGGDIDTSAGKKALGEALDGFVADMGTHKEKPGRGGKGGGGKGNRQNRPKTAEDEENKRVQKDIKTFFIWNC